MIAAPSKTKKEAEAERQIALEKLGDVFLQFAASPEGLRFLESQQAELTSPSNDPKYRETLEARDKDLKRAAPTRSPL